MSRDFRASQRGFIQVLLLVLVIFGITTFGVVSFQAEIVEREAEAAKATPAALAAGKKALLDYASNPPSPPFAFAGNAETVPKYNVYNVFHPGLRSDDIIVPFRPGQLPCPDLALHSALLNSFIMRYADPNASSPPAPDGAYPEGLLHAGDGNFDGVSDAAFGRCTSATQVRAVLTIRSTVTTTMTVSGVTITSTIASTTTVRATINDPLAADSNVGRLPWRDYADYSSYIRGAGFGDIRDGNGDRLWYAASGHLLDPRRPINQYKISRSTNGWLRVHINTHPAPGATVTLTTATIDDVAAVVISPGVQAPATIQDQSGRPEQGFWLTTPAADADRPDEETISLYLEAGTGLTAARGNTDGDRNYTHNAGAAEPWADRLSYISKHEVIAAFNEVDHDRHLDNIGKALEDYYERNRHLPDPATFEPQNANFVVRRLGRMANGIHPCLLNSECTDPAVIDAPGEIRPQGGRVSYDFAPASFDGSMLNLTVTSDFRVTGQLHSSDVPAVYLPPWVSVTVTFGGDMDLTGTELPPMSEWLHAGGTPQTPLQVGLGTWEGVIPAGTLLRLAAPVHTAPPRSLDDVAAGALVRLDSFDSGTYTSFGGDYNVLFADMKPGLLGNLGERGYATRLPAGTFIRTTVAVTIIGAGRQAAITPGVSTIASHLHAFPFVPETDASFSFGVIRDHDTTSAQDLSVPALTPVVAGSQGLLPTPSFTGQFFTPLGVFGEGGGFGYDPIFDEALAIENGMVLGFPEPDWPAIGYPEFIERDDDQVLLITDPTGAFGYFPAEVTMHALFDSPIDNPIDLDPGENPLRRIATPARINVTEANLAAIVRPYPLSNGDDVIVPSAVTLEGIVTMPHDTTFFYPGGSRIPLGRARFSHGASGRVFGFYNGPQNTGEVIPGSALYGANLGREAGKTAVAHLPPGSVIGNVTIEMGSTLPDGSQAAAATLHEQVTLVNGGMLTYTQLLHYKDGDFSMVPITWEQAAFRLESMGMGLVSVNPPLRRDTLPEQLIAYLTRGSNPNPVTISFSPDQSDFIEPVMATAIFRREILHDGFHVYPFHDLVVPMSRKLQPFASLTTAVNTAVTVSVSLMANPDPLLPDIPVDVDVTVTTTLRVAEFQGVTTHLDNMISRADVRYFTVGDQATNTTIVLDAVPNRVSLNEAAGFALVDELGVGVELDSRTTGTPHSYDPAVLSISVAVNSSANIQSITLDLDHGVALQANPGRMRFDLGPTVVAINTITITNAAGTTPPETEVVFEATVIAPFVALNQFGPPENTTPLVAPFSPGMGDLFTDSPDASLVDIGRSTATIAGVEVTTYIDPRASEVALHLSSATVANYASAATPPSDMLPLGLGLRDSKRAVFELHNDALLHDDVLAAVRHLVPKGSKVEYGWLPEQVLRVSTDYSTFAGSGYIATAGFFSNDFLPAGRVFAGVGFYPAGFGSALRFDRDQVSFINPDTITIDILDATDPNDPTAAITGLEISHEGGTELIDTNDLVSLTITNPRLLLPAGKDIGGGTFYEITVGTDIRHGYRLDNDVVVIGDTLEGAGVNVSQPVIRLTNDMHALRVLQEQVVLNETYFGFVANSSGAVVSPTTVRIGGVNKGQIFRMRAIASEVGGVLTDPPPPPEYFAMLELSWSGRDDHWRYLDMTPDDLIFAQNNPMFYAVADECRKDASLEGECATGDGEGLNAWVLPGNEISLPSESAAPPGLVVHGFRGYKTVPSNMEVYLGGATTLTLAGVKFLENGMLQALRHHSTIPNMLEHETSFVDFGKAGDTVVLLPGPRGMQFLHSDLESDSFLLPDSPDAAARSDARGHDRPLTVVLGGYTLGNITDAAHVITVDHSGDLQFGAGTSIAFAENIQNTVMAASPGVISLHLGPGSHFDDGGTTIDISGMEAVYSFTHLEVSLGADATRQGAGLGLPEPFPGGSTVTIAPDSPNAFLVAATELSLVELAPLDEIQIDEPGYAWQGLIYQTTMTVTAHVSSRLNVSLQTNANTNVHNIGLSIYYSLRDHNYDTAGLTLDAVHIPSNSSSDINRALSINLGMPSAKTLRDDWLNDYAAANLEVVQPVTVTTHGITFDPSGATVGLCMACLATIDISSYGTPNILPTVTTYTYPSPLEFTLTVTGAPVSVDVGHDAITLAGDVLNVVGTADYELEYSLDLGTFDGATITVESIYPDDPADGLNIPDLVGITLSVTMHTFEGVDPYTPAYDNSIEFYSLNFNSDLAATIKSSAPFDPFGLTGPTFPIHTAYDLTGGALADPSSRVNTESVGELPANTGFTLDRLSDRPTTITIGEAMSLPAPVALYRQPSSDPDAWTLTIDSRGLPTPSAARSWNNLDDAENRNVASALTAYATDASQLYLERRMLLAGSQNVYRNIVEPTRNVTLNPVFNDLHIHLDGDFPGRRIGMQVPVPEITVGGEVLHGGSLIYPEAGRALAAIPFRSNSPIVITLGPGPAGCGTGSNPPCAGAVANVVAGGGAGIPALGLGPDYVLTITTEAGDTSWDVIASTPSYVINGSITSPAANVELSITRLRVPVPVHELDPVNISPGLELDTRAMDAVMRNPDLRAEQPYFDDSPNLAVNPALEFPPALHRITIPPQATITIYPYSPNPGQRTFEFPGMSEIDVHHPTIDLTNPVDSSGQSRSFPASRFSKDVGGWQVDRVLEARFSEAFLPDPIEGTIILAGFNQDLSYLANDIYQNIWIRLENGLTVEFDGASVVLPQYSVVNPFLGTYMPPVLLPERQIADNLRITAPSAVSMSVGAQAILTRPALELPEGLTVAVGDKPMRFSNIKALLGYSPRPLVNDAFCGSASGALVTVSQLREYSDQNRDFSWDERNIPTSGHFYLGPHNPTLNNGNLPDLLGQRPGDAHRCMLLDDPENTDQDDWFIIGNLARPEGSGPMLVGEASNDVFKMVGGELVP